MSMDYFRIGLFLRPHGIKGELKLLPLTDDLKRFARLSDAFIEAPEGVYQTVTAESARVAAENSVIIKLKGIDTVEAAEKLRDKYLCVDREHAVKLPAGAYFVKDIIGCEVFSTLGDTLGRVVDVYETPSTDVYVIKGAKRLSVPALKKLLSSVDIENKRIVFDSEILAEVGLFED